MRVALALLIIGVLYAIFNTIHVRPFESVVMTKASPLGRHTTKLVRADGFDTIFQLWVDGKRVYSSPDFAPANVDFREQIAWDKSGRFVVLLVAGERIFGYDAVEGRPLTARETMSVEFTPFEELQYEGVLPIEIDTPANAVAAP